MKRRWGEQRYTLLWKQIEAFFRCCHSLKLFLLNIKGKKSPLWKMKKVKICFARRDTKLTTKPPWCSDLFIFSGCRFYAPCTRFGFFVHRHEIRVVSERQHCHTSKLCMLKVTIYSFFSWDWVTKVQFSGHIWRWTFEALNLSVHLWRALLFADALCLCPAPAVIISGSCLMFPPPSANRQSAYEWLTFAFVILMCEFHFFKWCFVHHLQRPRVCF